MIEDLEDQTARTAQNVPKLGAIVILSGDVEHTGVLSQSERLGLLSLQRVFFAAEQYRATPLPILVTGGPSSRTTRATANLMAEALSDVFSIPVMWRETRAATTYENAKFSAEILKKNGISTVIIVTQRWHMPRAIWAFAQFGIRAVPTKFAAPAGSNANGLADFVPSVSALRNATYALHELLGIAFYKFAH